MTGRRTGSASLPLHGGKDGTPYAVDRETYDRTIETMNRALEGGAVDRSERLAALKRLSRLAAVTQS